eukprot:TRINITY_DN51058_c0_g1_i1.p2 TRINITY_DN51058_c0_g1~~TRINITY_DN51058_c0_g1_i1.p2  ORF type:complete len:105 (+),score=29.32 TRINITY_DN51058_c0_g1_i1:78-392(+)
MICVVLFFFFQAEDGIRDAQESRGLGDVYKRQAKIRCHIIKSAIPGSTAVNKGRLEAYFTDTKVTEVMQGLKGGFMSRKDAKVIAPVCLSCLLYTLTLPTKRVV